MSLRTAGVPVVWLVMWSCYGFAVLRVFVGLWFLVAGPPVWLPAELFSGLRDDDALELAELLEGAQLARGAGRLFLLVAVAVGVAASSYGLGLVGGLCAFAFAALGLLNLAHARSVTVAAAVFRRLAARR